MGYTVISNKDGLDQAKATAGKFAFFNIHEGAITGMHAERLEQYSAQHAATTDTYAIDATATPEVKDFFGISALPAVAIFKDGAEIKTISPLNRETSQAEIQAALTA